MRTPPPEMTCGFLIQLVFRQKKAMWLIGVEVETSAPPPKKNPGSAPDSGEEVKTSITQKEKSKAICMEGLPEKYHCLLFLCIRNLSTTTTPKCTLPQLLVPKRNAQVKGRASSFVPLI